MDIRVIIKTKDGTSYEKKKEIPFFPYAGTILNLTIGDRQHRLVVEKLEWEDEGNLITARIDGSKMCDDSYYLKDRPNFYFEDDSTWRQNW